MSKYIDLSQTIENGMPVHPYDDGINFYQDREFNKDGYNNSRLEIGMHIGTHIDAPKHLLDTGVRINEFPIDRFVGNGCLLDVRNEATISMKNEYINRIKENDIVLFYTGYDKHYGRDKYYHNYPVIDEKLAQFLVEKGVKMIGLDSSSPDAYPFHIHKILFENNILIIENLRNLDQLVEVDRFEVIAFPIKINAEAALVRAVAKI